MGASAVGAALDDPALVRGNRAAEGFRRALDVLRGHGDPGQLAQQSAPLLEAHQRPDGADHPGDRGREGGGRHAERLVAGAETLATRRAVVVGAQERQVAERGRHPLGTPAGKPGGPPAGTGAHALLVGRVGVQPLFERPRGDVEGLPPHGHLERLEIDDGARAYERLDLLGDRRLEGRREPPFSAASCAAVPGTSSSASAQCSQASQ